MFLFALFLCVFVGWLLIATLGLLGTSLDITAIVAENQILLVAGVPHCYHSGASCDSASYNKTAHPGLSGWAVLFRGAMTTVGRGSPPS